MSTATIAPERPTAVDSEGFVYDAETGEVLGRVDLAADDLIDTPEKADAALEIRSRIEGNIAGIDARLRAVTEQLRALRREQERRLNWWDWRFGPGLIAFARGRLAGKARTVRFAWGSVSFRATKGTNEIVDMAAAVEWVRLWRPEAVRRAESVTVKDVMAAAELAAASTGEAERLPFLVSSGPSESVTVATGINHAGA